MTTQLFVYGTLTDPEKRRKVIGKTIDGVRDVLDGYLKSAIVISGNSYPDIIKAPACSVEGLVIPVTPDELELIDNYESIWYTRTKVVLKSGKRVWVYKGKREH